MAILVSSPSSVRTTSFYFNEMLARWELLYDLLGGTPTMREREQKWLPIEPRESVAAYNSRLEKTFLFNAFKRTIKSLVGSAFMNAITISNLPPELEYLIDDADGSGRSITAIAALLCEHILITGKANPYVDFPVTDGQVTVSQIKTGEIRPFINPIDPRDLFAWKTVYSGGLEHVTEIRFVERTVEQSDEWSDIEIERVRVVRPNEVLLFREEVDQATKAAIYVPEDQWSNTLGYVPIVPIYENKIATFVSEPPLEDLAWLNLRHWQSSSDQNNILHVVRVPLQLWTGFKEGSLDGMEIGANRAIVTDNVDAKGVYVEHTGQAIASGKADLDDLENRMAKMGSDILTQKSVSRQTASARQIDQAESLSTFQVILRNLEQGLEHCIRICGEWINVDASAVQVSIASEHGVDKTEPNPTQTIQDMADKGVLTPAEQIQELKRRSIVSPNVSE